MALPSSSRSARVSCGRRVNVFASMSDGSGAALCCAEEAPVARKPANTKAILFVGMDSSLLFVLLYGAGSFERRPVQHNDPRIERTRENSARRGARYPAMQRGRNYLGLRVAKTLEARIMPPTADSRRAAAPERSRPKAGAAFGTGTRRQSRWFRDLRLSPTSRINRVHRERRDRVGSARALAGWHRVR